MRDRSDAQDLLAEPALVVGFSAETETVTYAPEDDIVLLPMRLLFGPAGARFAAIRRGVELRWMAQLSG